MVLFTWGDIVIERTFSTRLLKLRNDPNLSQKQLAKEIGGSQASINYWEKGQRTPSIDAAKKLADYFRIPVSELLEPTTIKLFDGMTTLFSGAGGLELNTKDTEMNDLFHQLNGQGQQKVIDYAEDLTKIPEYRKDTQD